MSTNTISSSMICFSFFFGKTLDGLIFAVKGFNFTLEFDKTTE